MYFIMVGELESFWMRKIVKIGQDKFFSYRQGIHPHLHLQKLPFSSKLFQVLNYAIAFFIFRF